jgi:hypothetical protein
MEGQKNRNLKSVSAKKGNFFSPTPAIPTCGTRWAYPSQPRSVKNIPLPPSGDVLHSNASAGVRPFSSGDSGSEPSSSNVRTATTTATTMCSGDAAGCAGVRPVAVPHHDVQWRQPTADSLQVPHFRPGGGEWIKSMFGSLLIP